MSDNWFIGVGENDYLASFAGLEAARYALEISSSLERGSIRFRAQLYSKGIRTGERTGLLASEMPQKEHVPLPQKGKRHL